LLRLHAEADTKAAGAEAEVTDTAAAVTFDELAAVPATVETTALPTAVMRVVGVAFLPPFPAFADAEEAGVMGRLEDAFTLRPLATEER